MRIVVLGTRGMPNVMGGIETHCEQLYPHLVEKGCEIIVFTRKPYVDVSRISFKGVKLIPLPCPKSKYLETFVHTFIGIFAAKRINPDILHIHAIGPALFIPLARILGMKVVMTNHGPDYQREKWGTLAKGILKFGERAGSTWANGVICISKPIADDIKSKYKRDAAIIPNGVNVPPIAETEDTLKQFGLEKGRYILSTGRLVPEKGFHHLIDAFNTLSFKNWKLAIAGRTHVEDRYSIELQEKGRKNPNVVFTGFLTGKPLHELYTHAGLFVLPSSYEGLPFTLLEAMSYGLSCIASNIPGNRNVELDEDRYFEPGNVEQITSKIIQFARNPLSSDEREKQIRTIAEKYDWAKIADRTLDVYRSVCPH
jgi:glycosyltransferase involved in cell wall biosynthesis